MLILRFLNNLFGAILLTIGFIPLIALTTIARLFNFIDLLYKGKLGPAFFSIIFSPFTSLFMAVVGTLSLLIWGWNIGLKNFIVTFPTRISHFFKKKLFFGIQPEESIAEISVTRGHPLGLNKIVTSGFFGKLTLKLFSLCFPMEAYIAYEAKTVSPHHDVSLYFTEKNLSILKNKYNSAEIEQSAQIVVEINSYLASKLKISFEKVEELNRLPLSDDTRAGKLQSAQDEFQAIQAAQRCIKYFQVNRSTDNELSSQFRCTPATVLNYIWLAINTECQNEQNKLALKEKLIWTLFQIQRGINIVNGGIGSDMPECPTGAIGLLVRVICDEQEKMPNAEYEAADPSPANLTLALKTALDRPFTSSYGMINKTAREEYNKDSQSYKDEQKEGVKRLWRKDFKLLLESGVLQEEVIDDIINTGVDAWEPPFEQDKTTSFSV